MLVLLDGVSLDEHLLHCSFVPGLEPRQLEWCVDTCQSNCISRQHKAGKITIADNIDRPGHTTYGHMLRHLLHTHFLVLHKLACPDVGIEFARLLVILAPL